MVVKMKSWANILWGLVISVFVATPNAGATYKSAATNAQDLKTKTSTTVPIKVVDPTEGRAKCVIPAADSIKSQPSGAVHRYIQKQEGSTTFFEEVKGPAENAIGITLPTKLDSKDIAGTLDVSTPSLVTDSEGKVFLILPVETDESKLIEEFEKNKK